MAKKQKSVQSKQKIAGTANAKKQLLIVADIFIAIVAVGLIGWGMHRQLSNDVATGPCEKVGKDHQLVLQNDSIAVPEVRTTQCDTITIINKDAIAYSMNFGVHDKHIEYPGYTARTIGPDESITITMSELGTYELHDHFRDNARTVIGVQRP